MSIQDPARQFWSSLKTLPPAAASACMRLSKGSVVFWSWLMSHLHLRAKQERHGIKARDNNQKAWTGPQPLLPTLGCSAGNSLTQALRFFYCTVALGLISLGALHWQGARVTACVSLSPAHLQVVNARQHELICQQRAGLAPGPWQARHPGQEEMKFDSSFVNTAQCGGPGLHPLGFAPMMGRRHWAGGKLALPGGGRAGRLSPTSLQSETDPTRGGKMEKQSSCRHLLGSPSLLPGH